jgi:hypothetical protein
MQSMCILLRNKQICALPIINNVMQAFVADKFDQVMKGG